MRNSEKVAKSSSFIGLLEHVNEATYNFIIQQVRNQKLKPRGRRYKLVIYFWCKRVNLILRGKDEKFAIFMKSKPNLHQVDPMKLHARNIYLKRIKKSLRK